ncbi:RNA polymerase sigma-70 factor, ECF subfamily [Methylophilus rhizosphaerae]|uniref:RNA polymerase sigma-70 factor, ECF subfamily n=1 Tax=Methylophilus rhizosphaerae TaxID=492660 RepID=A0A1G8ZQM2_9PROT|nr:sigma-70 family RNA polymerase sigma factor [Methylophilus rhizosphaerae]SDK17402.1 RNA polymerase sigma-70 factor, ECF subfamily [Methylophilus rhizosphaerae]
MSDSSNLQVSALYKNHHSWLSSWLLKKLGCPHNAADIAQDTFVRLILKSDALTNVYTPKVYLVRIAKGLMIDQWRRQALEQCYLEALSQHDEPFYMSQELQAIVVETLFEIDAMLNRLNPKAKQAFLLAQIHGFGYKEIADTIGVSERMVKKYMAAAMMHCLLLRKKLNEDTV